MPPPGRSVLSECRPLPELLTLMEATSNVGRATGAVDAAGGDCAHAGAASAATNRSAIAPAVFAKNFPDAFRFLMIRREFRSGFSNRRHYKHKSERLSPQARAARRTPPRQKPSPIERGTVCYNVRHYSELALPEI
jgi:hypothetical protein